MTAPVIIALGTATAAIIAAIASLIAVLLHQANPTAHSATEQKGDPTNE